MKARQVTETLSKIAALNPEAEVYFVFGQNDSLKYINPKEIDVSYRQTLKRNTLEIDENTILVDLGDLG